jgi:uncharacterized protein (DUF2236 family)
MSSSLFGPESVMWRISRESVTLLGGRATVLMQLAHPLVAAGVAEHSDFRSDPLGRLRRTLDTMYTIVFGTVEEAEAAAASVAAVHRKVSGTASDGRAYSAQDPHLQLWVHATLVDSSVRVYEMFVAPLKETQIADYYEETKVVGRLFGIPEEFLPPTYAELVQWMDDMIATGEVVVTDLARDLAEPILRPLRIVPKVLSERSALVTPALLPEPIRTGYGLKLGWPRNALLTAGGRAGRMLVPRLPGILRNHPAAREAERRIA